MKFPLLFLKIEADWRRTELPGSRGELKSSHHWPPPPPPPPPPPKIQRLRMLQIPFKTMYSSFCKGIRIGEKRWKFSYLICILKEKTRIRLSQLETLQERQENPLPKFVNLLRSTLMSKNPFLFSSIFAFLFSSNQPGGALDSCAFVFPFHKPKFASRPLLCH